MTKHVGNEVPVVGQVASSLAVYGKEIVDRIGGALSS